MKGPLSADRLFFISSLVFVVGFIINTCINFMWPLPVDAMVAATQTTANSLGQVAWVLSIAGVVTFVLALIAKR